MFKKSYLLFPSLLDLFHLIDFSPVESHGFSFCACSPMSLPFLMKTLVILD